MHPALVDPRSLKQEEVVWFQKLEDPSDSSMMLPQKNFSGRYGFGRAFSRVGQSDIYRAMP
jgi:hypothetical protein